MNEEVDARRDPDADRIARLEERLARIEAHLDLGASAATAPANLEASPLSIRAPSEEEFEFQVGQRWFALAGIMTLTLGAALLLSLPFAALPAAVPSVVGYGVVAALLGLARWWRESFALVAGYLRGAAMALLFCATLRLMFPEAHRVIAADGFAGRALLVIVVAVNFTLALRRNSAWLAGVALVTGGGAALAAGSAGFALGAVVALAVAAAAIGHRRNWPQLALAAVPVCYATYLFWAIGDPLRGGEARWATSPALAPAILLVVAAALAAGPWLRPRGETEGARAAIGAMLNCGLGYGILLVHSIAGFCADVVVLHAMAFVGFLALATAFWLRHQSRAATFFYAMTGYAALSGAIIKGTTAPAVFVWLSMQSVVVVATAIWFRSRFIVVANFLIYVAIVFGYVAETGRETGISFGFGLVALVSARILNWQKDRLELKTELMRNAYLLSAFVVFPYALYHLVSARQVGLAWTALALGYYGLNFAIKNQKYRWMGHGTLLLTTVYLVVAGTREFEPVYRVLSFLALGSVLLVVSLVFTRMRKRRSTEGGPKAD